MLKGSSQPSWTSGPKVKGGGLLFSGRRPLTTGWICKRYYTGHEVVHSIRMQIVGLHVILLAIFTARIRRMTGGYIFSLSTLFLGGVPDPALDGGVPNPALDGGGYLIQPWTGGVPDPALDGGVPNPALDGGGVCTPTLEGGVPHLRGVPQPWMGGYLISGRYPIPCLGGEYPRYPPHRNSKHLLRLHGGRCASCVHAGGLSC